MNDYEKQRAYMLAQQGYVAFAADIYGVDTPTETMADWIAASGAHRNNATKFMGKIHGAISRVMEYDFVDATKLASVGYCFGGTGLINVAMAGHTGFDGFDFPTGLLGMASFHGGLSSGYVAPQSGTTRPKLLVHSGGQDDSNEDISKLTDDLESVSATYEIVRYGPGVVHSFTEWDANSPGQSMYDAMADSRSWDATVHFFEELFTTGVSPPGKPDLATVPSDYTHEVVPYVADGVDCEGFVIYDHTKCSNETQCPAVVIIQDWNGMNDYEKQRAYMLAQQGYVAFAADIYGVDTPTETMADWIAASGAHRNNATKFMGKIHGAISRVMEYDFVDATKLASVGYCFGGTGLINVAMAGHTGFDGFDFPTGLLGVASFHGGLSAGYVAPKSGTTRPALLVHSGAQDDSNEHIENLTDDLESVSAIYEISRYGSGVVHSFTEWDASTPGQSEYNARADHRSWLKTMDFFHELFSGESPGTSKSAHCDTSPGLGGTTQDSTDSTTAMTTEATTTQATVADSARTVLPGGAFLAALCVSGLWRF